MDSIIHGSDSLFNDEEIEVWLSSLQDTDSLQSDEIFIDNLVNDSNNLRLATGNISFENVYEEICKETLFDFGIEEAILAYLQIFVVDNNSNCSKIVSTLEDFSAHQSIQMSSLTNSESGCSSNADAYIPYEEFNCHQSLQMFSVPNSEFCCCSNNDVYIPSEEFDPYQSLDMSSVINSESDYNSNGDVHILSEELNENQSLQMTSVSNSESGCSSNVDVHISSEELKENQSLKMVSVSNSESCYTSNANVTSPNSRNTCINQETNSVTSISLKINNANKENTDNRKESLRNDVFKRKRLSEKTNIDPKNKKAKNDKDQLSEDMKQQRREAQSKATRKNLIKKKSE